MKRIVGFSVIAAALALGTAAPASANMVTVTYTGTIIDDQSFSYAITSAFTWTPVYSYDYQNQYVGQTASVSFTYDPTQMVAATYTNLPYYVISQLSGDSGTATGQSPYGSQTVEGSYGFTAQAGVYPSNGDTYILTSAQSQSINFYNGDSYSYANAGATGQVYSYSNYPFSLTSSSNYTPNPGIGDYATASFYTNVGWTDQYTGEGAQTYQGVDLAVTSFAVSGVPEPATWAMMIVGFAGVGFVGMRARRRESVAA